MGRLAELGAAEIASGVARGDFSAREVARAALDVVAAREPGLGAFLELTEALALEAAAATDAARAAGEPLGCLAGVPVAFKDNLQLVDTRTTCASRMLEHHRSVFTATCVRRMLEAGATPIGKTNMDEFAFGSSTETSAFQRTRNPWDRERVPGGSSGGSAAAVAAGEVALALGSDTGGSIRQPASLCGVVGLKPSYGTVSRYGVVAFGSSLDQVGPFGRSVADVWLAMRALTSGGRDPYDAMSQDCAAAFVAGPDAAVGGRRLGIVTSALEVEGLSSEERAAVWSAARLLEDQGAQLVEVPLPHLESAISAYYAIAPCEAFSNLARFDGVRYGYQEPGRASLAEQSALSRARGFGEEAKRRQLLGAYLLASGVYDAYYLPACQVRTLILDDYATAFERCDVLLMPTSPRTAWRFGEIADPTEMYAADMFTISANIAGVGAVSVPMGLGGESGLPVSAQLQAPAFGDGRLLGWARALEARAGFAGTVAPPYLDRGGEA